MTYLILCLLPFFATKSNDSIRQQNISEHFEHIRNDQAQLRAFFRAMPKGGDIHHHYSGAIYPETYLDILIQKNYYVNPQTLAIRTSPAQHYSDISTLMQQGLFNTVASRLIKSWSIQDFNPNIQSSHSFFFETFHKFDIPCKADYETGLLSLKKRAISEHVSYIETMFEQINPPLILNPIQHYNTLLLKAQQEKDSLSTYAIFDSLTDYLTRQDVQSYVSVYNDGIRQRHERLKLDDKQFILRYQNYIVRLFEPIVIFKAFFCSFLSTQQNALIVGINLVGPEHHPIALRDYWLHMMMCRYFKKKYPNIPVALHAGELTLNLTTPEHLSNHIHDAITIAKAKRIGHGVDISHENNLEKLLYIMKAKAIPVEINLTSNAFILGIKDQQHPVSLYKYYQIPIILASDDAGILRTTLSEQYVLLAYKYPQFSYHDIKKIVFNSLKYSFINNQHLKNQLMENLKKQFQVFEKNAYFPPSVPNEQPIKK